MCIGSSGSGIPRTIVVSSATISPKLHDKRKFIDFFILSNMLLPSSTASTIVAKLSSVRIISAACFDTSVPVIPIAQPMFAFLRAGASFTPSPVIATIFPLLCQALTILTLCSGLTLA